VKKAYPVTLLCKVMQVTRSGFYHWLEQRSSVRQQMNEKLVPLVREIHRESKGTYGTRRMARALRELGVSCGRARARTLMNLAGVTARQRRKFKVTTDSKHSLPVAPNLLERDFTASRPNEVWVSDITYIWTNQGWLYLAVVLDLFSRQVVGWSMGNRITRKLAMNALRMAFWRRRPGAGTIFHSDRGSQYCCKDFQKLLESYGMRSSMSRKGDCWDNAVAESFFGSLKTERVFFEHYKTREEARLDIVDYIEMFYNCKRLHSYLGYVSPRRFEEMWPLKMAA
jgi:transposase InsO family protein